MKSLFFVHDVMEPLRLLCLFVHYGCEEEEIGADCNGLKLRNCVYDYKLGLYSENK